MNPENRIAELLVAARNEMFNGKTGVDSPMSRLGRLVVEAARQQGDSYNEAMALFHCHHHTILSLPFDEALARLGDVQERCNALGVPHGAWLLQITRANLYYLHRRHVEAIDISLKLERRHGNKLAPIERAALYFVLQASCRATGRFDEVIEYASRALAAANDSNQVYAMAAARMHYASVLIELAMDPEAGLPHLEVARGLLRMAPQAPSALQCLATHISALDLLGRNDEALQLFRENFSTPEQRALGRDTSVLTVSALLGADLLEEAEAWLGDPPALTESDHAWRRRLSYCLAKMRLLCAKHQYAQARFYAETELDTPHNTSLDPLFEVRMYDKLREACAGLGDEEAAYQAAVAAREACLPVIRLSSRARYLVSQLSGGATGLRDLSPIDLRRLAEIDKAVDTERQASGPTGATNAAGAAAASRIPRFLSHVVHELRAPIGGVMGLTSLLKRSNLDPSQRRYASMLEGSANTMLLLVNDILDLAKLERGQFMLNPQPMCLDSWLKPVVEPFAIRASALKLTLNCILDEGIPPRLEFDPLRLQQVLANLLGNAVKFTEAGQITLRVRRLAHGADTHCALRFEVQDSGCGIAPGELNQLFQEFVQANAAVASTHGGTGLGLALCKQLVDRMHGRIGVDSVVGQGSTFWFELALPIAKEA